MIGVASLSFPVVVLLAALDLVPSVESVKLPLQPRQETESPCAQIFNSEFTLFTAEFAFECLSSVPFNATVATEFIGYYKDTLQFHSSLAYLKSPPPSYQQPAVDVLAGLDRIESDIKSGAFSNEYEFELAVQKLLYATHDAHLVLYAGAMAVFSFGSPLRIVSVSKDGIELPKVYITDDLIESQNEDVDWEPSAVVSINGIETVEFLSSFAAQNSLGLLEPHADWNQVMSSPAGDIQGLLSSFEGSSPFYPGENITFNFENKSTTFPLPWLATYFAPADIPLISSGKDFYTYFVLGEDLEETELPPPDSNPTLSTSTLEAPVVTATELSNTESAATTASASSATPPPSWDYFPYPADPSIVQPDLGNLNGGVVTGYLLNDDTTAVLSIPSFDVAGEAILSFSNTIAEFIRKSKEGGYKRVIIDVQRNGGAGHLLATDTFKQFFPSIDPFDGSRLRAHGTADTLGNTFTAYFNSQHTNDTFYDELAADIWVATDYLNANTDRNFTSWSEFFGPTLHNGDYFTTTQRYNLSSQIFDEEASGGIVVYGYANRSVTSPQPYAAEDIIILSDAVCHSACAAFVEMMHHDAGVRTVVAGGLPKVGSMQVPSGSRGAEAYSSLDLDADFDVAVSINASTAAVLPNRDVEFYVSYAGFNIKDAIREGSDTPLQFLYEAADCRIYYTARTVYNYLNLWNYVVDAIWRNPSLCVSDSTSPNSNQAQKDSSKATSTSLGSMILRGFQWNGKPAEPEGGKPSDKRSIYTRENSLRHDSSELNFLVKDDLFDPSVCQKCPRGFVCPAIPLCEISGGPVKTQNQCKRACSSRSPCGKGFLCNLTDNVNGFCETPRAIKVIRLCQDRADSSFQDLEEHPPVGFNVPHLPYSRSRFGSSSSYRYAAPAIRPGGR